jgi:hypothetical protein
MALGKPTCLPTGRSADFLRLSKFLRPPRWGLGAGIEYSPPPSYNCVFSSCDSPSTTIDVDKRRKDWLLKHRWRRIFEFYYTDLYWY